MFRQQSLDEAFDLRRVLGSEVRVVEGCDFRFEVYVVVEQQQQRAQVEEDEVADERDALCGVDRAAGVGSGVLEDVEEGVDRSHVAVVAHALREARDSGLDADHEEQDEVQRDDVAVVHVREAVQQHEVHPEDRRHDREEEHVGLREAHRVHRLAAGHHVEHQCADRGQHADHSLL